MPTLTNKYAAIATFAICSATACAPDDAGNDADISELDQSEIVNGEQVGDHPYIERIVITKSDGAYSCTASWIAPARLLTAAHCVDGAQPNGIEANGKRSTNFTLHPEWNRTGVVNDIAIVNFKDPQTSTYGHICQFDPQVGEPVTFYGYGLLDRINQVSTRTLHRGTNEIDGFLRDGEFINLIGRARNEDSTGIDATAAPGDSGGPLFINDCIMGVASNVTGVANDGTSHSRYVNVRAPAINQFLKSEGAFYSLTVTLLPLYVPSPEQDRRILGDDGQPLRFTTPFAATRACAEMPECRSVWQVVRPGRPGIRPGQSFLLSAGATRVRAETVQVGPFKVPAGDIFLDKPDNYRKSEPRMVPSNDGHRKLITNNGEAATFRTLGDAFDSCNKLPKCRYVWESSAPYPRGPNAAYEAGSFYLFEYGVSPTRTEDVGGTFYTKVL